MRFLKFLGWGLVGISCFLILFLALAIKGEETKFNAILTSPAAEAFDYQLIGKGPLSLKGQELSKLFISLTQNLVILGRNSRPDVTPQEAQTALFLVSSNEQRLIKNETPIFLDISLDSYQELEKVRFAPDPSNTWIVLRPLEGDTYQVEVEGPLFSTDQKMPFVLKNSPPQESGDKELYLLSFQNASLLGIDKFFERYGGSHYQTLSKKQKVEFLGPTSPYVLFLAKGDLLHWEEGKWNLGAKLQTPLALVEDIRENRCLFKVWDESGFRLSEAAVFSKQVALTGGGKSDAFLKAIRFRNSNQITALMGNRRLILKPGDWLMNTKKGWKNLKTIREIDA